MKATLTNFRQSPRKVALVAGLIRGKKVSDALSSLRFAVKRAGDPIEKLLQSAISNAKNAGIENPENLYIIEIRVDKGITLKRWMPRARGSAAEIKKRSSHVTLSLGEKGGKSKVKSTKSAGAKPVTVGESPALPAKVTKAVKTTKSKIDKTKK